MTILENIKGSSYLTMQAAWNGVESLRLNMALYRIEVVDQSNVVFVLFQARESAPLSTKSFGVRSGAQGLLNAYDFNRLMEEKDVFRVVDAVDGSNFRAIQAGVTVFQQHKPELQHYKIQVVDMGEKIVVIFLDLERDPGGRGGGAGRPGFEVELGPKDLHLLRASFVR